MLTSRLAHIARLRGISSFHATVMGSNHAAQAIVRSLSPRAKLHFDAGYLEADIPLRPGVRSKRAGTEIRGTGTRLLVNFSPSTLP